MNKLKQPTSTNYSRPAKREIPSFTPGQIRSIKNSPKGVLPKFIQKSLGSKKMYA